MSKPNTCRSCGARIMWARTVNDKSMPLDPVQDENGNVTLSREPGHVAPLATVWSKDNPPPPDTPRYISHFATCPNRAQHRKEKTVA